MQDATKSEGLPTAAERRRISQYAEQTLKQAWALMERLDQLELERERAWRESLVPGEESPRPTAACVRQHKLSP